MRMRSFAFDRRFWELMYHDCVLEKSAWLAFSYATRKGVCIIINQFSCSDYNDLESWVTCFVVKFFKFTFPRVYSFLIIC